MARAFQKERNNIDRDEQLKRWLAGDPQHDEVRDECVPDYSCCHPELLVSIDARRAYWNAHSIEDHETLNHLIYAFLARKLSHHVRENTHDTPITS